MDMLGHRFLRYFPPAHAKRLARAAQRIVLPAGRVIFEENDASDAVYLVLSGRVEILKRSSGDHFQTLATAGENDYFGELGVLDGSGRSARAVTQTRVVAALLPRAVVLEVLGQCPWKTTMGLFVHVIQNLREADARFVQEVIRKEKITLIGEMANGILHDFRSPVTSIQLALGTISKRGADEGTRTAVDIIGRQLKRMGSMVEEVLEYARGETRLQRRPVAVRDLLADLVVLNANAVRATGATLRVFPANLTPTLDHDRMLRVLQNLVSNALEAVSRRRGGIVTVSARRHGGVCQINVRDNGPGIPKVILGSLFQPFTTYGKRGGTGLGLAIAKAIVDAHGGRITFESRRGAGTVFHIQLPLRA